MAFVNEMNSIVRNTFGDDNKFLLPITVYLKFEEIDESKAMNKENAYKLMIWCLDLYGNCENCNILKKYKQGTNEGI